MSIARQNLQEGRNQTRLRNVSQIKISREELAQEQQDMQ